MPADPHLLDDLAKRLAASLPASLRQAKEDIEHNLRAALEAALTRLDLVSREEFDAQTALLRRTRERLDALAAEVEKMEHGGGEDHGAAGGAPH
ncbi:MAG TPA: accessory factor UbiK family protein [Gammaproteobacteria bacterium]|nr:accessory factor UbiK family protein [Gammaproteobacteria bacterium]